MEDAIATTTTSSAKLWNEEYRTGGIPSSVRLRPSNVVVDFVKTARERDPRASHALDIGCGGGRNSIYLAQQGYTVSAIDFCQPQVERLRQEAQLHPEWQLDAKIGSVTEPWPWPNASADIAIDAFCFKHQIEPAGIQIYLGELRRCLKKGGLYMLFLAMREDGYYGQFAVPQPRGIGLVIVDRGNQIASRLYSQAEIEALFVGFGVVQFNAKVSRNEMHGQMYERHSGVWYFRRE